jgi:hypothetical protein
MGANWPTNLLRICIAIVAMLVGAVKSECQTLAPVDMSAFGKDRPLQATFTQVTTSECKGAAYFKNGQTGYDGLSYDIQVSANLIFKNRSSETVLLYKKFDPASTERVGTSVANLLSGKFVTGFDVDRTITNTEPAKVSIEDFLILQPGKEYASSAQATVYASTDPHKPLHAPGRYWVQMGIDARPDDFYFNNSKQAFQRKWLSRGKVVNFILSEPFSVDITFDPKAPACERSAFR